MIKLASMIFAATLAVSLSAGTEDSKNLFKGSDDLSDSGKNWLGKPTVPVLPGEIVVRSSLTRNDVSDFISVSLMQPDWTLDLPDDSWLEYDVWLHPDNPNQGAGVNIYTASGDLRKFYVSDQNGIGVVAPLNSPQANAIGKWLHRRISLSKVNGTRVLEIILIGAYDRIEKTGINEVRYRNLKIIDNRGKTVYDFTPVTGMVLYPLLFRQQYKPDVMLEIPGMISGSFIPERYLTEAGKPLSGRIILHNFDGLRPLTVSYDLAFNGLDKTADIPGLTSGQVSISPLQTIEIPVALPALPDGHYRSELGLTNDQGKRVKINGFAITALSREQLNLRPQPFQKGGIALGAVSLGSEWNLPALREQGANYYQLRVDWAGIEPSPGIYDFKRIDKFLQMARSCGMKIQIDFYSGYQAYTVPRWYLDQQMLTNAGERHGGPFTPVSYWSAGRQAGLKAMTALIEYAKKYPEVVSYNSWTGGNMDSFYGLLDKRERRQLMDYSDSSHEAFRRYVREELKLDLAAVNRRYQLDLKNWSELMQPQPLPCGPDLRPYWQDFMNYRSWSVEIAQDEAASIIKKLCPDAKPEFFYGGSLTSLRNGNDFNCGLTNAVKFNGAIHHTASPGAADQMFLGGARRHFGIDFSIETAGTPAITAEHQHAIFELLREGAAGYTWIQSPGILLRPTPAHGMGEFRQALERIYEAKPAGKKIAVICSYSQQLVDFFQDTEIKAAVSFSFALPWHLEAAGYNIDLFTDRTRNVRWQEYPLVIDEGSEVLDSQLVDEMLAYVRNGGNLIAFSGSGRLTPGIAAGQNRLLHELGCEPASSPPENGKTITVKSTRSDMPEATIHLNQYRPLLKCPDKARIIARDNNGNIAIAAWQAGKGNIIVLGGYPAMPEVLPGVPAQHFNNRRIKTAYPGIMDLLIREMSGIQPEIQCKTNDVYSNLKQKGKDCFLTVFNQSPNPQTAQISFATGSQTVREWQVYDLVGRTPCSAIKADQGKIAMSVSLQPYQIIVYQLSPDPIPQPIYDSPRRCQYIAVPEGAITGDKLLTLIKGDAKIYYNERVSAPICEIPSGATVTAAIQAPGQYRLEFGLADMSSPLKITFGNGNQQSFAPSPEKREITTFVSSAIFISGKSLPLTIGGDRSETLRLAWLRILPEWEPVKNVFMSKRSDNPGNFPGSGFYEALPDKQILAQIESGTEGWRKITSDNFRINLAELTGNSSGQVTLVWTVEAANATSSLLSIGVDYGILLRVNGKIVFDSTTMKGRAQPVEDEFSIPVELQKGPNLITAKIVNGSMGWCVWLKQIKCD